MKYLYLTLILLILACGKGGDDLTHHERNLIQDVHYDNYYTDNQFTLMVDHDGTWAINEDGLQLYTDKTPSITGMGYDASPDKSTVKMRIYIGKFSHDYLFEIGN